MDFVTAEEKFQELQARIRRGEPMSEDQYQEELAQLMVQDEAGVFWSLEPGTGRWLSFNGTEWVPGTPPKQAPPPPPSAPTFTSSTTQPPSTTEPSSYTPPSSHTEPSSYTSPPSYTEPSSYTPPSYPQPTPEPSNYYVPSDTTRPVGYPSSYTGSPSYSSSSGLEGPAYTMPTSPLPSMESESMPTYVRMPEPDVPGTGGGIPPRPVREASPLAVPGGERAWLPFAFGALVLLLCAVVLFFGVRGLPQFNGGSASNQPTEEPTQEVSEVLPTETVELVPTDVPAPTEEPTIQSEPTEEPQPVKATTTDVLNIRQGPARTTPSLGKLPKGTEVTVVGRNADASWLQIQIPNKTDLGWVSAEFVTITGDVNSLPNAEPGSAAPEPTATPTG